MFVFAYRPLIRRGNFCKVTSFKPRCCEQFQQAGVLLPVCVMPSINSFRQLVLWQKSMDLAVECYGLARRFPRDEREVLGYQIRKSAVSIPSNIAEGFSRHSTAFYVQHLWTAHGSDAELETQIELGRRIRLIASEDADALIARAQEVGRMINGLVNSLERTHTVVR